MFRFHLLPTEVRILLSGLRSSFRYRHFLVFSWLLTLQLVSGSRSNLKELSRMTPHHVAYWHLRRFLAASYWWSQSLLAWFVDQVIQVLPPPDDGICYLLADSTVKDQRGRQNPALQTTGQRCGGPYLFGLKLVLLVVHWGPYRIPVDFALVRKKSDPKYKNEHALFRTM